MATKARYTYFGPTEAVRGPEPIPALETRQRQKTMLT